MEKIENQDVHTGALQQLTMFAWDLFIATVAVGTRPFCELHLLVVTNVTPLQLLREYRRQNHVSLVSVRNKRMGKN